MNGINEHELSGNVTCSDCCNSLRPEQSYRQPFPGSGTARMTGTERATTMKRRHCTRGQSQSPSLLFRNSVNGIPGSHFYGLMITLLSELWWQAHLKSSNKCDES